MVCCSLLCCITFAVSSCKRNTIHYYTTGISLSHYDNCGPFIRPAGNTVGDSGYVMRINYASDQTSYYSVDDNNTYALANLPTAIRIYSLQQFDTLHPAGTLLNEYFIAGPGIHSTAEDVVTGFPYTQDYYPTHDPDDLWLMKAPTNQGAYNFIVEMAFDNGALLRDTTSPINLVR